MKVKYVVYCVGLGFIATFGIELFLGAVVASTSGILFVRAIHDRRRTHMAVRPYLKHQFNYGLTVLRLRRKKEKEENT